MTVTELELKTPLLQKKREGRHFEQILHCNRAKTESPEARITSHQDQGACRDGKSLRGNTKQTFQLEFDCKRSHRFLPRFLFNSCGPKGHCPIRDNLLDEVVEKLEKRLCRRSADLNKKMERVLSKLKNGKGSPEKTWAAYGSNHSLHCDTIVCRRRLCRKRTQMLAGSCCGKRQNDHESGRKRVWWCNWT